MFSKDKIPDHLGHLILNDDGAIVESAGELENNEHIAKVIFSMLNLVDRLDGEPYQSLSVVYDEGYGYVVTISNKKIHIVKRKYQPPKSLSIDGTLMAPRPSLLQPSDTSSIDST